MTLSRRFTLGAAVCALALPSLAQAQQVTLDVLYNLPGFTRFHQPLADAFMENNPDVTINFLAPAVGYNEGQQQILRGHIVGQVDVIPGGAQFVDQVYQRGGVKPSRC